MPGSVGNAPKCAVFRLTGGCDTVFGRCEPRALDASRANGEFDPSREKGRGCRMVFDPVISEPGAGGVADITRLCS